MPAPSRRKVTKPRQKIVVQKATASEIIADLRITRTEWEHAKRAVAAAEKGLKRSGYDVRRKSASAKK